LRALEHREPSRQLPLLRDWTGGPSDTGCAVQAQSACESRGNRIRESALGAEVFFLARSVLF